MCEKSGLCLPNVSMDKLICSECKRYLRTGPIKTKSDGDSVCGKCSEAPEFSAAVYCKALNELLRLFNFPCAYANLGCTEYLKFNDNSDHEDHCVFRSHSCPALGVACKWVGRLSQIPQHCRENHAELYSDKPTFKLNLNESTESRSLLMLDRLAFVFSSKVSLQDGKLWLNLAYLGDKSTSNEVTYKMTIHGEDKKGLKMMLKERVVNPLSVETEFIVENCVSLDIKSLTTLLENTIDLYCSLNVRIPKEVLLDIQEKVKKIKCPNCLGSMAIPIYECPEGHITCSDCTLYSNRCGLCKKSSVMFHRNLELETLSAALQLKCRWPNCRQLFEESSIRQHERTCEYKRYKCPRCYQSCGVKDDTIKHFAREHESHPLHTTQATFIQGDSQFYDFYLLVFGEIFACSLFETDQNGKNFSLWYYGSPSYYNNYNYQVEVSSHNPRLKNKTYTLEKCAATDQCFSFNIKIPNEDIEALNGAFDFIFKIMKK